MRENFQDALDSCYYEQLEHDITGYEIVPPKAFLDHLKKYVAVSIQVQCEK